MKRAILATVALLALAGVAQGHGDEQHFMGKVTKISGDTITVEAVKKEAKTVEITAESRFLKGESPASLKDVRLEDRVVVHATQDGDKLRAIMVRLGQAAAKGNITESRQRPVRS